MSKQSLYHRWCWHRACRRFSRASARLERAELAHTDHLPLHDVSPWLDDDDYEVPA